MEQKPLQCFQFIIVLAPIPGAFIEGEHQFRLRALMLRERRGAGFKGYHQVNKSPPPITDVSQVQSLFCKWYLC